MIGSHYHSAFKYSEDGEEAADRNVSFLEQRLHAIQNHSFDAYDAISVQPCCSGIAKGLSGILSELAFIFPSWKPLHLDYEK
jgi:hypothetical protein